MYEVIYLSENDAALRRITTRLVRSTDGVSPATSSQVTAGTARLIKNGADHAASTNNITETHSTNAPGFWYLELTASELTALGVGNHAARFKEADTLEGTFYFQIVPDDVFTASTLPADIAAAVLSATIAELSAVPTSGTTTVSNMLRWLYQYTRNKRTQSASTHTLYKADGSTSLGAATTTDASGTLTHDAFA
jgi:hypothetical protein